MGRGCVDIIFVVVNLLGDTNCLFFCKFFFLIVKRNFHACKLGSYSYFQS